MKKLTVLTIIFILSQIFTANIALANSDNKAGFLSGSAWMDNNDNNIQELDETNMADVIVFIENATTRKLVTAKTDATGFFTVSGLSYGRYTVWSENTKGVATTAQVIEVSEVNGTTMLDLVFASSEATTQNFTIFLPIVNN